VVAAVQGGMRGTVRAGIMQSMVLVDLAELLARFRAKRPFVRIEPRTLPGGSADLAEAVGDGRLDAAFASLPTYERSLDVVPQVSDDLVLALPPNHELLRKRQRFCWKISTASSSSSSPIGAPARASKDYSRTTV
jgi:DNA-binding transcriptional LysR family regulator